MNLDDIIERLDILKLQVGVIDSNVGKLTSLATRMDDIMIGMNHRLNMINHNLTAYFNSILKISLHLYFHHMMKRPIKKNHPRRQKMTRKL